MFSLLSCRILGLYNQCFHFRARLGHTTWAGCLNGITMESACWYNSWKTIRLTYIYINVDGMHIWTAATIDNETEHSNMKCTRVRISLGTCAFCAITYNQWHTLKMVIGRHHLTFSKITYKNKCKFGLSAVQFNTVNFVMCTAQSILCESRWWWRDNENDIFLG